MKEIFDLLFQRNAHCIEPQPVPSSLDMPPLSQTLSFRSEPEKRPEFKNPRTKVTPDQKRTIIDTL